MLARFCTVAALIALGSVELRANVALFSVKNATRSRWRLVDKTRDPEGAGYRIQPSSLDPAHALSGAPGGGAWVIEPNATLIFKAEAGSGFRGGISIGLGPEDPSKPLSRAEITMPLAIRAWAEAPATPHTADGFGIVGEDRPVFVLLARAVSGTEPGAPLSVFESKAVVLPVSLPQTGPARAATRVRARDNSASAGGCASAVPVPDPPQERPTKSARRENLLTVRNLSAQPWILVLTSTAPVPAVTVLDRKPQGAAKELILELLEPVSSDSFSYAISVPSASEVVLPCASEPGRGSTPFRKTSILIMDKDFTNPFAANISFQEGPGGWSGPPALNHGAAPAFLPPSGSPIRLSGNILEIEGDTWGMAGLSPAPPAGSPVSSSPSSSVASGTPSSASIAAPSPLASTPPAPGDHPLGIRPDASPMALPLPALAPAASGTVPALQAPVPRPGGRVALEPDDALGSDPCERTRIQACLPSLRVDLEYSSMFLGVDEGLMLGGLIGIDAHVYTPLTGREGKDPVDKPGCQLIAVRSRVGTGPIVEGHAQGLVLLYQGRHYSVLRPAPPGVAPRYATEEGATYVEVTSRQATADGERDVPIIPSDGHCLIASLHFLKTGALPEPAQVRMYRHFLATGLSETTLEEMAGELIRDTIRNVRPVLPSGCFSGLGPLLSAHLYGNRSFMTEYLAAWAEQASGEALLEGVLDAASAGGSEQVVAQVGALLSQGETHE